MKTFLSLLAFTAIICISAFCGAQTLFNVQNGAKTEFYKNLEEAIEKAVAGDTIYLPGATIQVENDLIIDKKLALIGAGWDIDHIGGLQPTIIKKDNVYADINFRDGSDGSFITGCQIRDLILGHREVSGTEHQNVKDLIIWRNYIEEIHLGISATNNNIQNIHIKENWVWHESFRNYAINGYNASQCHINNNVLRTYNISQPGLSELRNSIIYNNIILGTISGFESCRIENNYIRTFNNRVASSNNCVYNNNASDMEDISGNNTVINNCLWKLSLEDNFIGDITIPKNCIPKDNSPLKNAGTDGTDIGIFGGSSPFKLGAQPFNPHIDKAIISGQTDGEGKLKIDIQVSAQER